MGAEPLGLCQVTPTTCTVAFTTYTAWSVDSTVPSADSMIPTAEVTMKCSAIAEPLEAPLEGRALCQEQQAAPRLVAVPPW